MVETPPAPAVPPPPAAPATPPRPRAVAMMYANQALELDVAFSHAIALVPPSEPATATPFAVLPAPPAPPTPTLMPSFSGRKIVGIKKHAEPPDPPPAPPPR